MRHPPSSFLYNYQQISEYGFSRSPCHIIGRQMEKADRYCRHISTKNIAVDLLLTRGFFCLGKDHEMKIAVKNGKDAEWKRISNSDQQGDDHIQNLINLIPELICAEEIVPGHPKLEVCIQPPSPAGDEDAGGFIGVDHDGNIAIVECKISSDSSIRGDVIGQALEYAASLWQMSYEEFDKMVSDKEGKPLIELMKERVSKEEWSEEEFERVVTSTLNQGRFRLMLTVSKLTDELKRTIKFLNARAPFSFETYVIEMQHFSEGDVEIVFPRVASAPEPIQTQPPEQTAISQSSHPEGPTFAEPDVVDESTGIPEPTLAQPKQGARKDVQKEDLFFAKCRESTSMNAVEIIKRLYDFSAKTADDIIWWGSGGAGAFNYVLTKDGLTVFIVDANGKIMFNFSEWQRESLYKDLLPRFLERLRRVEILRRQKDGYTRWPDFNVEEFFADAQDFTIFEESVVFLKQEIENVTFP